MIATGRGVLYHHFFGDYSASVVLAFDDGLAARAALPALGAGWRPGQESPRTLVWSGEGDAIEALKARLRQLRLAIDPCGWGHCRGQCADAEIDGVPHSIDVGPAFTIEVECADPRQTAMEF